MYLERNSAIEWAAHNLILLPALLQHWDSIT